MLTVDRGSVTSIIDEVIVHLLNHPLVTAFLYDHGTIGKTIGPKMQHRVSRFGRYYKTVSFSFLEEFRSTGEL